jgi:hypothetical protein
MLCSGNVLYFSYANNFFLWIQIIKAAFQETKFLTYLTISQLCLTDFVNYVLCKCKKLGALFSEATLWFGLVM